MTKASEQMKRHWGRCEKIAELLDITKGEANMHWSCCLKTAVDSAAWFGSFPVDVESGLKAAYANCMLKKAKRERHLADWREDQQRPSHPKAKARESDEPPDLDGRIKIMLWAIKTCGSVEKAEDALGRAVRSLQDHA